MFFQIQIQDFTNVWQIVHFQIFLVKDWTQINCYAISSFAIEDYLSSLFFQNRFLILFNKSILFLCSMLIFSTWVLYPKSELLCSPWSFFLIYWLQTFSKMMLSPFPSLLYVCICLIHNDLLMDSFRKYYKVFLNI